MKNERIRLESGWFANDGSKGGFFDGDVWWMHSGDVWVSPAELGIEGRCDLVGTTSVGNTTFFFGYNHVDEPGCPDLWILSLDP